MARRPQTGYISLQPGNLRRKSAKQECQPSNAGQMPHKSRDNNTTPEQDMIWESRKLSSWVYLHHHSVQDDQTHGPVAGVFADSKVDRNTLLIVNTAWSSGTIRKSAVENESLGAVDI